METAPPYETHVNQSDYSDLEVSVHMDIFAVFVEGKERPVTQRTPSPQ